MKKRGKRSKSKIFITSPRLGQRKGQVTIFIIVGILLVSSVLLFFLSRAGFIPQLGGGKPETSVNAFLNTCLEKEIKESIELILKNGGYIESQFSTKINNFAE